MMQEFEIKITVEEANILAMGLGKLPLEVSVALWQKLKSQVEQQVQTQTNSQETVQ